MSKRKERWVVVPIEGRNRGGLRAGDILKINKWHGNNSFGLTVEGRDWYCLTHGCAHIGINDWLLFNTKKEALRMSSNLKKIVEEEYFEEIEI